MLRNIFLPTWPSNETDGALNACLDLAKRHNAHIEAVFIRPDISSYYESISYGSVMSAIPYDRLEAIDCESEKVARVGFESWRRNASVNRSDGISSYDVSASWSERQGYLPREIARKGRLSDLIVMNLPNRPTTFNTALDAALFETARPVLALPASGSEQISSHIAIAWNGSLSATRAVIAAMPILQKADRVSILMVNAPDKIFIDDHYPHDLDLKVALHRHGIQSEMVKIEKHGSSVGDTLLRAAQESEVSMMILGAYTNGRVIEALTNGVTRRLLRNTRIPILLAH